MKRIKPVIRKEFSHILRDPKSLIIIFVMPILMIFIYGYAISFDLDNIKLGVLDYSKSDISREFIKSFLQNKYFKFVEVKEDEKTPDLFEKKLKRGDISEVMIIPHDFSDKIKEMKSTEVGFIIDGSDSNSANIIYQYNEMITFNFIKRFQDLDNILKIHTKVYFNPEVKSAFFFIPGLVAVLLLMVSALLTSLSISRERESGSIDLIFISPIKSHEIILGKTLAYIFVALMVETLIIVFSRYWFGMPVRGDILTLLAFSLLYIFTGLSLGVLISISAPDQKTAMLITLLVTMLPSIMLSGFIFPLSSLSPVLRGFSNIVPATYFLKIIRGVILKGASVTDFIRDGAILLFMSIILTIISVRKFSKNRDRGT
ncbi:MAG: ABC transporter permease [Acidobacteriota bacterium]